MLLVLFLFNVGGYYAMFFGFRLQANQEFIEQLNEDTYSSDGSVIIKIHSPLPYQTDWKDYERVNGEFEYNGEFYKLVKQKLERDTLYVVCVKDPKQKQLVDAMADFTKLTNDLPSTSKTTKLLSSFSKEYKSVSTLQLIEHEQGWCTSTGFFSPSFSLLQQETPVFSPPPQVIC